MVFLKECFEKVDFEKKSADDKKHEEIPKGAKKAPSVHLKEHIHLLGQCSKHHSLHAKLIFHAFVGFFQN